MKHFLTSLFMAAIAMTAGAQKAAADGYCREYTRTVYIGGNVQNAYGTACLQPDGSWMIVGEGLGNDITQDAGNVNYVIHDNRQEIVPPRVVYYETAPRYYYRSAPPRPYASWNNDGRFYRNGIYVNIGGGRGHGRDYGWRDRYDRHDWRDHPGRGHGRWNNRH